MSDFTSVVDQGVVFSKTELDTGVDFTDAVEGYGRFEASGTEVDSEFFPTGDAGILVATGTGFGEGGFGEGPFGGTVTYTLNYQRTQWTNVETP